MKIDIAVATNEELKLVKKARQELTEFLSKSEVPPHIWMSVFSFITIQSVDREKMSYDDFIQTMTDMFSRYRDDWK